MIRRAAVRGEGAPKTTPARSELEQVGVPRQGSVPPSLACIDNCSGSPFCRQSLHLARIGFATARRRIDCVGMGPDEPPNRVVNVDSNRVHPLLNERRI